MYSEGMLRRYAEQISDPEDKALFLQGVDRIEFDADGLCVANAVTVHLQVTPALRADFQERYLQFISQDDFPFRKRT